MARKKAVQVDNKFIRGLITDTTALNFPEDACTDTLNCVFKHTGLITRRPGLQFETPATSTADTTNDDAVYTEYLWNTNKGVQKKTFAVYQYGAAIEFYDCSSSNVIGDNHEAGYTIDLNDYLPSILYYDPSTLPCQYTQGNNQLVIANKGTQPILVTYDDNTDSITATAIILYERDFDGLEDGLDLYERVTSDVATLKTANPEHYYNLLNQGWHSGDALSQWDTARTDLPSNSDQVLFFRASETDAFDNARVTAYSAVLNTPAPKGHFILEVGNYNRTAAMTAEGFTGASIGSDLSLISGGTGTLLTNFASQGANAFDGTTSQALASCANQGNVNQLVGYIGRSYSPGQRIVQVKVYGPNNAGMKSAPAGLFDGLVVRLYGKTGSAPANATDGTLLGTSISQGSASSTSNMVFTVGSNDNTTLFERVWVTFEYTTSLSIRVAEVEFYTQSPPAAGDSSYSVSRPDTVAFFAGRVFYAGMEDGKYNNKVYFSRVILKDNDYGKCHQQNDPTSEFLSEVLSDDGGVVRIAEAGRIIKLFAYQNSVLVFASNGVWRISGFVATDYTVRKISSVNIEGAQSVVDVKGIPIWWAEDGIYTVQYEANFDAFSVQSLTNDKIKEFYLNIPRKNRKYIKGAFNIVEDVIYWLYNDDADLQPEDYWSYNSVLCMNTRTGAFYPWSLTVLEDSRIRGILFLQDSDRETDAIVKLTIDTDGNIFFASANNSTSYRDWVTHDPTDYESFFITGYKMHGDAVRFGQPNYIMVFLDTVEDASCYMHGIFDWTNSGISGKWSQAQQIYNPNMTFSDINYRRLKVRGKGRSIQLKFTSDTDKPFAIQGWSLMESQNADV